MTDKEKAVVMAYTGIAMLTGNKFEIFHKYVEEIMSRPVFTHELATYAEEIKERANFDFLALCAEEEPYRPHDKWEYLKEHITEMRDADGKLNQKQTCQFILNLMSVIEREGEAREE